MQHFSTDALPLEGRANEDLLQVYEVRTTFDPEYPDGKTIALNYLRTAGAHIFHRPLPCLCSSPLAPCGNCV